jgi:hypothetical protein
LVVAQTICLSLWANAVVFYSLEYSFAIHHMPINRERSTLAAKQKAVSAPGSRL